MALNFEKFAQEGNEFLNDLSYRLNHPESRGQVNIILRSVLHVLRDRITVPQSIHLMAQLPVFLKGIYVDQWKYRERPLPIKTMREFCDAVKEEQAKFGERQFNWNMSTEDIVKKVLEAVALRYISAGEITDVVGELPAEIKQIFEGQHA
jgi:uncharacterized protein (DUF2267 family)